MWSQDQPARFVRLSPSGELAAVACGTYLEVWDLSHRTLRSSLTLTNDIWRVVWQPGEERLAIGCRGGLRLWDIGAPEAATLRGEGTFTVVFFNADGDLSFTAGWDIAGEAWSVPKRCVVLRMSSASPLELSRDQVRLSAAHDRVGYGIQQFLPPAGVRHWPAPPSLGSGFPSADVDREERWLLTAHARGWLIRDAQ